ncbi:b42ca422-8d1c-44fb-962d-773b72415202 [Thermothielavioides terrestris]|nr:b42ca422-8d1c-44fb-962d-773b72415202 [Thermothielavioides terrestris]
MAYMASVYLTSTLRLIERETRQSRDDPEVAFRALARPSATERLRAVRAHYRLQMLLHLWECARADDSRHLSTVNGLCALLFALWEPWELQQVFGLGAFYMRLRPVVGRHPFQDQMVRRDVTGREGFYCFDAFRTHIRFLRLTNEPVWQATVAAMSNPPPGLEATGQAEEGRLAWFRFKLYDCYGAALHAPPPPEPPLSLRFTPGQEHVDNVPFAWVDAFDGRYGNNFWRLDGAPIREKGVSAVGIWSLLGMVMWDAPRAEALKEVSVALSSHCAKGWALLGTRNEHYY